MHVSKSMILFVLLSAFLVTPLPADEGMWPMSEIHTLDLAKRGLAIQPQEIYNPGQTSLVDGICKLGGCTGSFVSADGLILTNHHCAFRAVQSASSAEHDYLTDGFHAAARREEIPAKGYTLRITESYRDVSAEVLSVVTADMDPAARTKAIERRTKELIAAAEQEYPGKRAEIAEMFLGKTYVLFLYTYLRDVRLVYVPPLAVGNFGGEEDNWMWPRHTGDFSFMRAYVAPDGSPADYAADNVPYQPRKVLAVNPQGVAPGDFVFLFGYPGRTYRHRTAAYLEFESRVRMPFVVDWYGWQIDTMERLGAADRVAAIKLAARSKGLSNTWKNYRGKLKGIGEVNLLARRRRAERQLQEYIAAEPDRQAGYGDVLPEMEQIYREITATAPRELTLQYLVETPTLLGIAFQVNEAVLERQKPDLERRSEYMDRNFPQTRQRLELNLQNVVPAADRAILTEILNRAARLQDDQRIPAVDRLLSGGDAPQAIADFLDGAYARTRLTDPAYALALLRESPTTLPEQDDPFLTLAAALYPHYQAQRETEKRRKGQLDNLYSRLLDIKQAFEGTDFIPDANGTLRLTYGHIKGYSPRDGVTYRPLTTLRGVMEKETGEEPFIVPPRLRELYEGRDFGRYASAAQDSVPVAMLYDADTTGGNSGSPVFDARGRLVGVNFDRAWEATINDYAWDAAYSRSIAVDIRYVLWFLEKYAGATHLLQEMNVAPEPE
ncbi:MAG: S46 family peptidase [Acidobacteria bacterium]|nr:S46 family peptidase [Acidobacteriota bacterium]